ncbi:MBL fold metallo-hydrolase [Metabacillus fastidiosus]|uniref:MBL fold metallo-hydrolase n=1 Tax=Metabacillus fastidiosus TaxID=1458 RepID=UPI003D2E280F
MTVIQGYFKFRNVGQGLFYTGMIRDFNFVYDCGVENGTDKDSDLVISAAKKFRKEVDNYRSIHKLPVSKNPVLDLLVISHFDWDHISGLKELLTQFNVDTVIIPYVMPIKRLEVASRSFDKSGEHLIFLKDPVAYFDSYGVRNIVIIGGNRGNGHINNNNELVNKENNDNDEEPIKRDILIAIDELTNDQEVRDVYEELEGKDLPDRVNVFFKDSGVISIGYKWEFIFFNYDHTDEMVRKFEKMKSFEGGSLFDKEKLVRVLSSKKRKLIKREYSRILSSPDMGPNLKNDINNTSVILYHGPVESVSDSRVKGVQIQQKRALPLFEKVISHIKKKRKKALNSFYDFQRSHFHTTKVCTALRGTLLMGDISVQSDFKQIESYFNGKWTNISVMSVPHHGSKYNWFSDLLKVVKDGSSMWVVSAGTANKYAHPDPNFIEEIKNHYPEKRLFFNNELMEITILTLVIW